MKKNLNKRADSDPSRQRSRHRIDVPTSASGTTGPAAVLVSGGVDSAVLCVDLLREHSKVHPIYVRFGLRWESVELECLKDFLQAVPSQRPELAPLTILEEPISQVYGAHWSNIGERGVPDFKTADEAVYLPGRNVLLAAKAAVWCRLRDINILALGTLKGNPFPDSSPTFFKDYEAVLNHAMQGHLRIVRPYERLSKIQVIGRAAGLPLHLTFSCLDPTEGKHCGVCNKCQERREAFRKAGWLDRTEYVASPAAILQNEPQACIE